MKNLRKFVFVCLSHIFICNLAFADSTVLGQLNVLNKKVNAEISNCRSAIVAGSLISTGLFFIPLFGWGFMPEFIQMTHGAHVQKTKFENAKNSLKDAQSVLEKLRVYVSEDENAIPRGPLKIFLSNFSDKHNYLVVARKILELNNSGMNGLFSRITLRQFTDYDYYEELVRSLSRYIPVQTGKPEKVAGYYSALESEYVGISASIVRD